jgi:hypothetical protein
VTGQAVAALVGLFLMASGCGLAAGVEALVERHERKRRAAGRLPVWLSPAGAKRVNVRRWE